MESIIQRNTERLKKLTCQELHNKVVLQPSPSDRHVRPLLLIDVRKDFDDFDRDHIYFSIHVDFSRLPTKGIPENASPRNTLELVRRCCLRNGLFDAKFNWRQISDIVLICSDDEEKKRCNYIYKLMRRENPSHRIFKVTNFSLKEIKRRYWYLMTNSYIQTYHYFPSLILEEERVYLGSYQSSTKQILRLMKIKFIVNCASTELPNNDEENCEYLSLPLQDDLEEKLFTEKHDHIKTASDFIISRIEREKTSRRKGKLGVLIHCRAGRSRSVSLVVGFLMRFKKWSLEKCLEHIKLHRPIANPNPSFKSQLGEYEKYLNNKE